MDRFVSQRLFFPTLRAAVAAGLVVSGLIGSGVAAGAQAADPAATPTTQGTQATPSLQTAQDGTGRQATSVTTGTTFSRGKKKPAKEDKVVQSKDTRASAKKVQKADALAGVDSKLPDKQLYDKALAAIKKGHFDVARLDLQTMLNTYPDSQYQMRAKLAIADSWYKEGGTAALTQAESEYSDFRVFFPNAPEAAEAQMRIGDIYFRQMDKPDRDYAKAMHAEEEYRRMLTDYPNADPKLTAQARQRLRDVQEVLAFRESDIASFYATHENWAATIARYQTVVDTYPLYSHMDDTLIGLGDAYGAEARYIRTLKLPEAGKARLEKLYDGKAAAAYRAVVLEHAASPHVEDARDRLAAMNMPIPQPTREQIANSEALENSRRQYSIQDRAVLLFMHTPDTVSAARLGDPTMVDPPKTLAPTVNKAVTSDFRAAFDNKPVAPATTATDSTTPAPAAEVPAAPNAPAEPLALKEVGNGEGDSSTTSSMTTAPAAGSRPAGNSMGVEVLTPGAATGRSSTAPVDGLTPVRPATTTELPPVEKAADAPSQPNEINAATAPAQAPRADGKRTKPAFDKSAESSSKHQKKKGLKKVNPF